MPKIDNTPIFHPTYWCLALVEDEYGDEKILGRIGFYSPSFDVASDAYRDCVRMLTIQHPDVTHIAVLLEIHPTTPLP